MFIARWPSPSGLASAYPASACCGIDPALYMSCHACSSGAYSSPTCASLQSSLIGRCPATFHCRPQVLQPMSPADCAAPKP